MKPIICYFLMIISLFSCKKGEDPSIESELFKVTINPNQLIDLVSENGRVKSDTNESSHFTDMYYYLFDSSCNEIDSDSKMFYDTLIPNIILPNLSKGSYYYKIGVSGQSGIRFDSASYFILRSDTIIEADLKNHQMRYRFLESSNFNDPDVYKVSYYLNFSTSYRYDYSNCSLGEWGIDHYDGYVSGTYNYHPFSSEFKYNYPVDIKSVTIKFYDHDDDIIMVHNIPIVKVLQQHHSYTFEINLSDIWSENPNGSYIEVNVLDVDWTEETIDLNE